MAAAASSSAQLDARKAAENEAAEKADPTGGCTQFERAAGSYNTVWAKSSTENGGWISGSAEEAGPSMVPQSHRLKDGTPSQSPPTSLAATKKLPGSLRKISIVEPTSESSPTPRASAFERGRSASAASSAFSSVGSASSIPEWKREGLGADMIEALERIERDAQAQAAQQPPTQCKKSGSLSGLRSSLFGLGRASSTDEARPRSRSRTSSRSSRDARKAELRRAAEESEPPFLSPRNWEISAPFEVDHKNNSTVGEEFLEAQASGST